MNIKKYSIYIFVSLKSLSYNLLFIKRNEKILRFLNWKIINSSFLYSSVKHTNFKSIFIGSWKFYLLQQLNTLLLTSDVLI